MANRRPVQFLTPSKIEKKLAGLAADMVLVWAFSWFYSDEKGDGGGGDDGTAAGLLLLGTIVPLLSSS